MSDKAWIQPLLSIENRNSMDYNFSTVFVWRHSYHHRIARMDDFFLLRAGDKQPLYLFPAGQGELLPVLRILAADAKTLGVPFTLSGVSAEDKAKLEQLLPDRFAFTADRDGAEYVYKTKALATLQGKKLAGKRNHVNRFLQNNPHWVYEVLSSANLDDVRRMNTLWCIKNGCAQSLAISDEYCAVESAIRHYDELGLMGGLIRNDDHKVVAFSIGEALNDDTFLVHFEKAFSDVQGAYQMINQQFVQHNCLQYSYINREEDAGVDGLRRAKLSYHPAFLVEKYLATLKEPL